MAQRPVVFTYSAASWLRRRASMELLGQEEQPDICPPATRTTAPTAPAATPAVPSTVTPATPPAAPPAAPLAEPPAAPSATPPAPAAPVAVAGRAKDGASSSGYGHTVGTVAQLIAQGPQQASACCTRLTFGTKQGWLVLCSAHRSLQQSEQARSVVPRKPPDPSLPTVTRWPAAQPVATTSISARWRQKIKKQRMDRRRCTASSDICATDCDSD